MNETPGLPARRAALQLLDAVFRRGQPLESALAAATRGIDNPADRALAHAIAAEVLRRTPDLDDLIDSATRQRLPDDAKARMVIRIGLVQALILGTPHHAAVATALPLVDGGPRRLVHGVLGSILRSEAKLRAVPMILPGVEQRWDEAWGPAMVSDAAMALAAPPPVDLTLRDASETEAWTERLNGESLAPGHVRLPGGTAITELPGFEEGAWWVQNISASIPARLLGQGGGRAVLDLCASPGGKTMQLASADWQVTAVESNAARHARLRENLERTKLEASLVEANVMRWEPAAPVPAILLDAPCSATGIFARHPDVLHRVRPKDIAALAETQAAMLARAGQWLTPDGVLVYATCSLEPEEGEQIAAGCGTAGLAIQAIDPKALPSGFEVHSKGWLRILPKAHRDGFFIMQLRRK
jgi:16S rRNA (cytosine967-C5)-methyltransferase